MEKRESLKVKNKKMGILVLFLLVVLVGCSQKNAEEMTIGEGSFHPNKNDEIVLEGSVSPKEIKYQVVDSNDKVTLEGVTKNGLSDIKFKAPKKEDSFYTLKSGELEEEFYVYSIETKKKLENDKLYIDIIGPYIDIMGNSESMKQISSLLNDMDRHAGWKNIKELKKSSENLLAEISILRSQLEKLSLSRNEISRDYLVAGLDNLEEVANIAMNCDEANVFMFSSSIEEELEKSSENFKKASEERVTE